MSALGNLNDDIPAALAQELATVLASGPGVRVERIVSRGQVTEGWYDQEWNEWVLLVSGAAHLRFEGDAEVREMRPGDYVDIAAHRRHRVEWTDPDRPTVWLAVHYRK